MPQRIELTSVASPCLNSHGMNPYRILVCFALLLWAGSASRLETLCAQESQELVASQQRAEPERGEPAGELFEASRVIAVVGEERILIGDLFPPGKLTAEMVSNPDFEMQMRKALRMSIHQKCLAQHFLQSQMNGKPKKEREEIRAKMMAKTAEIFRTKVLPEQVKRAKVETEGEFIQLLEDQGTSLTAMMKAFTEQVWADQEIGRAHV